MELFLAIAWSFILIVNIVQCAIGVPASWFDVFVPLVVVFCECWLDWVLEHFYKRKK